jgi:hypothetical protein
MYDAAVYGQRFKKLLPTTSLYAMHTGNGTHQSKLGLSGGVLRYGAGYPMGHLKVDLPPCIHPQRPPGMRFAGSKDVGYHLFSADGTSHLL